MTLLFACSLCTSVATAETVEYWDPVGKGAVTVAVKAIPGLKYELRRGVKIGSGGIIDPALPGDPVIATGTRVTLSDDNPPADNAFYVIGVSVP